MVKGPLCIFSVLILLFAALPAPVQAQDMLVNGNFELQTLGNWSYIVDNQHTSLVFYDADGDGTSSYCLERKPGTPKDNGGIAQDMLLVAGVTYQFDADVNYYSC